MRVIHSLAWYFPESTGGTEVYVAGLVKELAALGVVSAIAAPRSSDYPCDDIHDGATVHRYPFANRANVGQARGEQPPRNFEAFLAWLDSQPRGIYHQHSWTTSCGLYHIRAAKQLGFKTVLTVHVPGNICIRGTMMEFGHDPCDGRVEPARCAACWSQGRGLSRSVAHALGRVPEIVSRTAYRCGARSRLVTAISAREFAAARRRQIAAMADSSDRIVAVSSWLAAALRRNGIADAKLVVIGQGVDRVFIREISASRVNDDKFRLGFLGRYDPIKGLFVLLEALKRLPRDLAIEFVIHGVANTEADRLHRDTLMQAAAGDSRIKFLPPVERTQLPAVLAGFDMLAVPSQWQETGPLIVLEAQALGVPVLGSNLGGIAEHVASGVDGHLVEFSDPAAWAEAIRSAVASDLPCLAKACRSRSVRTMAHVAQDMAALYASIACAA